jgi:hypothetical protein
MFCQLYTSQSAKSHVGLPINIGWNYHLGVFLGALSLGVRRRKDLRNRKLQPLPSRVWMSVNLPTEMMTDSKWPNLPSSPFSSSFVDTCNLYMYPVAIHTCPPRPSSLNHSLCYSSQKTRPLVCHPSYPPALSLACFIGISPKILVDQVYRLILSWFLDDQRPLRQRHPPLNWRCWPSPSL